MNPSTFGTDASHREPSSREIRHEIEHTRREMDRDLDALEQKLTPSQLALEGWSLLRDGSTAGASRLWSMARQHPGTAAAIGLGVAWMLSESLRGDGPEPGARPSYAGTSSYSGRRGYSGYAGTTAPTAIAEEGRIRSALHTAKEKVADAAETARETVAAVAGTAKESLTGAKDRVVEATATARRRAAALTFQARERARYQSRQARIGFWQAMEENPLAVGAAALALGVLAGLLLPSTRKEDELLGETRDRLLERARDVGEEALEKGRQVAAAALETAKQEAELELTRP